MCDVRAVSLEFVNSIVKCEQLRNAFFAQFYWLWSSQSRHTHTSATQRSASRSPIAQTAFVINQFSIIHYSQLRCIFLRRYPFSPCPIHTHTHAQHAHTHWHGKWDQWMTFDYTRRYTATYRTIYAHARALSHTHTHTCPLAEILSHFWHIFLVLSVRKSHVHYAHSHLSVRHCIAVGILAGHIHCAVRITCTDCTTHRIPTSGNFLHLMKCRK